MSEITVCDANDALSIERDKLRADIAERDARIERAEAELVRIAQLPTVTYLYKFPYLGGFVWRHSAIEFNGASAVDSMELIQRPEQVLAKVAALRFSSTRAARASSRIPCTCKAWAASGACRA